MLLLISDTNILLDWEAVGHLDVVFQLGATLAVPDVLLVEELSDYADRLQGLGLQIRSLSPEAVARAASLVARHRKPGRNDILALALAEQEGCPLLTGDRDLRAAAEAERVTVHGTLWLAERAVVSGLVSPNAMRALFQQMRATGRRLPWQEIDRRLRAWGVSGP